MKIKFNNNNELILYLKRINKVKYRYIFDSGPSLLDLRFDSENELIKYLNDYLIIETIFRPIEFKNDETRLIEYKYEVDSILLNASALDALESNKLSPYVADYLLTIQDVCKVLRLTKPSVYKLFDSYQLPYYTILSQKKVRNSDLLKFLESNKGK
jgi:excisionase family DNA binding protein